MPACVAPTRPASRSGATSERVFNWIPSDSRTLVAVGGDAMLTRCVIEAEAHRFDLARRTCEELLANYARKRSDPAEIRNVKRSLAQAAYWGGDYLQAAQLATEVRAAPADRLSAWSALLTLAAATHKLGRPEGALRTEIKSFLNAFEQSNGATARRTFLNRRPFREFLTEAGIPVN